jgi:hypothetical protein
MYLTIALIAIVHVIGVYALLACIARAPEGHEDEDGFHYANPHEAERFQAAHVQSTPDDPVHAVGRQVAA